MCAPSPPPAPDYRGAAVEQGAANLEAARATARLSNPNITNPYGSRTVSYDGDIPYIAESLSPSQQAIFDSENRLKTNLLGTAESGLNRVSTAMANPFDMGQISDVRSVDPSQLQEVGSLNPSQLQQVRDLSTEGMRNVKAVNTGNLNQRTVDPTVAGAEAVTSALMERNQPFLDRQRQQKENDLLIQGHNRGGEAWTAAQDDINRQENDARLAAILAGGQEQSRLFGLESQLRSQGLGEQQAQMAADQSLRSQQFGERGQLSAFDQTQRAQQLTEQQAKMAADQSLRGQQFAEQQNIQSADASERQRQIQEQAYLRQLPLNEINALRTGNQVIAPQFQPYQGATVNAAPLFDATLAGGNYAQQQYQNQLARSGGLFDLGGSLLTGAGAAGGFGTLFGL